MQTLISIIEVLMVVVPALLVVAFTTVAERRSMASMQRRSGPNMVGYHGLLLAFIFRFKALVFFFFPIIFTSALVAVSMIYMFGLIYTIHMHYIMILYFIFKYIYDNTSWHNYVFAAGLREPNEPVTTLRVTAVAVLSILIIFSFFFSWELNICLYFVFGFFHRIIFYLIKYMEESNSEFSLYPSMYGKYNTILIIIYLLFINYLKKSIVFLLENPTLLLYIIFRIITFIYLSIEHLI